MHGELEADAIAKVQIMLSCGSIVDQELDEWEYSDPWVARYEITQAHDIAWIESDNYPDGVHVYQVSGSILLRRFKHVAYSS